MFLLDMCGVIQNEVSQTSDILLYFLADILSPTDSKKIIKKETFILKCQISMLITNLCLQLNI